MGFLLSLHLALTTYINSSFLSSFIPEKWVGLVYISGSLASILALLLVPKIFRLLGGYKFLLIVTTLNALCLLGLTFVQSSPAAVVLFILYFALSILIIFSLDEIIKIFSNDSSTGKTRGVYLAICNAAWIIAQLGSSRILGESSFRAVYFIAFVIMILFFLVYLMSFKEIPDPKYDKSKAVTYIKEFFRNKNLFRAYKINLLLQFFFAWMVIYTPVYLHAHLGFSWEQLGVIFAVMLVPFFIFPFPLGEYSDKIGERKMLMLGFTIISLATLSIFFINSPKVWVWAGVLFLTRVGAATIEIMSDVYFFKHIKAENEQFVGIYRSTSPVAYVIGPLAALATFTFIPAFNYIYVVLGAIMLYGIYLSSTIRKGDI